MSNKGHTDSLKALEEKAEATLLWQPTTVLVATVDFLLGTNHKDLTR